MSEQYILGIDQSTQGTKAVLLNQKGAIVCRADLLHRQIINDRGWVSHDGDEIYNNVIQLIPKLLEKAQVKKEAIAGVGISNQRETTILWDKTTGKPLSTAVVWQCARAQEITEKLKELGYGGRILTKTGLPLSPYFPAAKMSWLIDNVVKKEEPEKDYCIGTMDSYLVYRLTGGKVYKTDCSNASRTQLMNLKTLSWDEEICSLFQVDKNRLPEITDSDGDYGVTDFEGYFDHPVPIRSVMGDSHGALYAQCCYGHGMVKATYGTGSSIMMNVGDAPIFSRNGLASSVAWRIGGKVNYVLEGNLNYTGAVITWLKDDVKLIASPKETEELAWGANPGDTTYFVPAFSGLGAPYWDSEAKAGFCGMTRITGRNELVKAALDSIAYQICDVVRAMEEDAGIPVKEVRVDGGPTENKYLMQFQADILGKTIRIPQIEELSVLGCSYLAGLTLGVFHTGCLSDNITYEGYQPELEESVREQKINGWLEAVLRNRSNSH
jgi:glycerol kinase